MTAVNKLLFYKVKVLEVRAGSGWDREIILSMGTQWWALKFEYFNEKYFLA